MRTKVALALALSSAANGVRLKSGLWVDPQDEVIAKEAKREAKSTENMCINMKTPVLCQPPPGMAQFTAEAVISAYREDIHWINEMPWSDNVTVVVHDRQSPRTHNLERTMGESVALAEASEQRVKKYNRWRSHPIKFHHVSNIGDESSSYLGWIIHEWDNLPDVAFFLHGHRCAVHAKYDMSIALPNFRQCFRPEQGYLELNAYQKEGNTKCGWTSHLMQRPIAGISNFPHVWKELFQEEFGRMPTRFCWDSYSQFAVSRDSIKRHPLEFYRDLLKGVARHNTSMALFWRAIFVPDAIGWEKPPKRDRFGRAIKTDVHISEEDLREDSKAVGEASRLEW
uniref:Uncharacterized protein n=1 Tax=Alexandrium monilatum TaxID=311494 RepID=A0A6T0Y7Y0_9DINO|mmetsp:Transcript_99935/g.308361  ORF Transcript_99935/g.308361 Transcript_99935/m.308361 type:complete len:340 (+) Transcript_99935:90-1109(+)